MPVSPDDLVVLGVVTRPHGIRGELRVHLHNPDSTLLYERDRVVLRTPEGTRDVALEDVRRGPKGAVLMRMEGVATREDAEAMRGAELCVLRAELPPTDEDEWYHVDLVGLEVRDPDGTRQGEVIAVIPYPTIDCLCVRSDDGEREVPISDEWLRSVDLEAGHVVLEDISDILPAAAARRRRK